MPRNPHLLDVRRRAAPDRDLLAHDLGALPRAAELVARRVGWVEPLDEQILHVGLAAGDAPGDPLVVADHHAGHSRQARAGDVIPPAAEVDLVPRRRDLRGLVDDAKKQLGSGIAAIIGVSEEGKAALVVGVTPDLTSSFDAVELARVGAEALGGKGGGGRPDLAQAGGPDGARADQALEAIAAKIAGAGGSSAAPAPEKRRSGSA